MLSKLLVFRLYICLGAFLPIICFGSSKPPDVSIRIDNNACSKVATAAGPHSLLALANTSRLLISSHDRRRFERAGSIQDYDTRTLTLRTLIRTNEPKDFVLRPHHMDSVTKNSETLLYVINHDNDNANGKKHSIIIYKVEANSLTWQRRLQDPLLSSPNHISVASNGDIYISNDRRDGSSIMELAMRMSRANIVLYREGFLENRIKKTGEKPRWSIVADGLNFANGVKAEENQVLVPMTFGNALLSFPRHSDGTLGAPRVVASLPALEGINPGPDANTYLVVSHGPLLNFLRHQKNSKKHSAGTVYLINTVTGNSSVFFADDGSRISAMSNAILDNNALYIGQSFDSFILRCPFK